MLLPIVIINILKKYTETNKIRVVKLTETQVILDLGSKIFIFFSEPF